MNEEIIEHEQHEQSTAGFTQLEADAAELDGVEHASVAIAETLQSKTLIKTALAPLFTVIAPNWNVSDAEIDALSESYGALLDKYCPDGYSKYSVEIAAIVVTASVIAPRTGTPRKLKIESEQSDKIDDKDANETR